MFTSEIFTVYITSGYIIQVPEHIGEAFLSRNLSRIKATASFAETSITFHAALRLKIGIHSIMFGKRYQKELGVSENDTFQLQLFEDTSKYGVEMPEELSAVFESDPKAYEKFEALTAGKKRSIIYFIIRIKTSQTKIDKALLISENLKRGITDTRLLTKTTR